MSRFTKNLRQQIIRDFCARHGGEFDARVFEGEVREAGPSHPAYEWFEWDTAKAALEYRVEQARAFCQGLRISFTVEDVGRKGPVIVREVEAPFAMSPLDNRGSGGGYYLLDVNNPDHMAELCRQARTDLSVWLGRYGAALVHAGGSIEQIERQIKALGIDERSARAA